MRRGLPALIGGLLMVSGVFAVGAAIPEAAVWGRFLLAPKTTGHHLLSVEAGGAPPSDGFR